MLPLAYSLPGFTWMVSLVRNMDDLPNSVCVGGEMSMAFNAQALSLLLLDLPVSSNLDHC